MSDHPKQPKPNRRDRRKDERRKNTQKRTPAPSLPPSPSTTPAPSNKRGLSSGATGISPSNPKRARRGVDNGEEPLARSDTANTGTPDNGQSRPVGRTCTSSTIINVHGGVGGLGGQGGERGGHGGTGEGPTIPVHSSNVYVTNPDATKLQFIKEKLAGHVAAQHKFTDQSKSLCALGTRVEIQADINRWLLPGSKNKERIFWITGIAGSGKSTLSATLVDNLRKKGTPVAAQFFISRNILETIKPNKIIPTIAQQLAESFPTAARIIHDALKGGFPPSRKEQVEALLLAPIQQLSRSCNAVIILIDALDELENAADSVKEILESIAPRDCDLPDNVRFLVTSRPEHWADISVSKTLELTVFKQCPLMTESSMSEVHNFIIARMQKITPMGWDDWPTQDQLLKLSGKANGLFHYAATALQWIGQQISQYGKTSQKRVFDQFTQMGIGQLEDLYRLILTSFENIDNPAENADWRASQLRGFHHVIGAILVLDEPLTICQIIALLADIPENDFDVGHFLKQMHSVLIPGTATSFEEATPQMHKSFRDYIMDEHAPAEFRILTGDAHFVTAKSCLEVIFKAQSHSDVAVKYSVQHWYKHLRKAVRGRITCEDGGIWNLFGPMVEKAVVGIWAKTDMMDLFVDVATAGWGQLKQGTDKDRMKGISSILMKAKEVHAFPPLPMFGLLTFSCLLVSSSLCEVRDFPPLPMFVLLTFVTFLSLATSAECVLSLIAHVCLAHFFSPYRLQRVRAFPPSPMFVLLTFFCLLVSSDEWLVRAFPPSPIFVLLTSSRLVVSSQCLVTAFPPSPILCVLFPHRLMFGLLTFSCLLVSSDLCEVHAFPPSPMFVLLTFSSLLVSRNECRVRASLPLPMSVLLTFSSLLGSSLCFVRAFPPSPMFGLLTFSCLLVSSLKYVLFLHCPCLSCPLLLAFLSLALRECFSPIVHDVQSVCFALPPNFKVRSSPPPIPIQIVRPSIPFIDTHITFLLEALQKDLD
ncbi:hypothetical protein B0H19DRAFT_1376227 [Mycena capillaripes]|nr:hypothetical protein B0H19DRAFT_1376227 [Mycena capillaripes]